MSANIDAMKSEFVTNHPDYNPNQHCTAEDCYTFSHTAHYCNKDQPRFCACAFDYEDNVAQSLNEEMKQTLVAKVFSDANDVLRSFDF